MIINYKIKQRLVITLLILLGLSILLINIIGWILFDDFKWPGIISGVVLIFIGIYQYRRYKNNQIALKLGYQNYNQYISENKAAKKAGFKSILEHKQALDLEAERKIHQSEIDKLRIEQKLEEDRKRRREYIRLIEKNYGPHIANAYSHKEVVIGMPMDVVENMYGKGHDPKRNVTKDRELIKKKFRKFHKELKNGRLSKAKYKMEIEFEKSKGSNTFRVSGFKDKDS